MGRMIVLVEHCSTSPWSIGNFSTMTYENIAAAMRRATRDGLDGSFVGPGPRVVRRSVVQEAGTITAPQTCLVQTSASWVFEYPDPPVAVNAVNYINALQVQLRSDLARTMETANNGGDWAPAVFVPYSEEQHGPMDFWLSGEATRTRTRNGADAGDEENRVGPNSSPTFVRRETASDFIDRNKVWFIAGAAVVGVGALAYVTWKMSSLGVFGPSFAPGPVGQPYYPPTMTLRQPVAMQQPLRRTR